MPSAKRPRFNWQLRTRSLPLGERTLVMGIVNVTPDSFSDGGTHTTVPSAVDHALRLLDEGADIVDLGGESTRPGSPAATNSALPGQVERERVLPVIEGVLRFRPSATVSIDTYRSATARAAAEAGAEIVNDVSGLLWDRDMAQTVAETGCGLVLMHTRGLPSGWQTLPPLEPGQVVPIVESDLSRLLAEACGKGIAKERIVADPGFGFGKLGEENWQLLAGLQRLAGLGFPLLAGLSRKGFVMPSSPPQERDPASHAAHALAVAEGAHLVRVHDVAGAREAVCVADAVLAAADRCAQETVTRR